MQLQRKIMRPLDKSEFVFVCIWFVTCKRFQYHLRSENLCGRLQNKNMAQQSINNQLGSNPPLMNSWIVLSVWHEHGETWLTIRPIRTQYVRSGIILDIIITSISSNSKSNLIAINRIKFIVMYASSYSIGKIHSVPLKKFRATFAIWRDYILAASNELPLRRYQKLCYTGRLLE